MSCMAAPAQIRLGKLTGECEVQVQGRVSWEYVIGLMKFRHCLAMTTFKKFSAKQQKKVDQMLLQV